MKKIIVLIFTLFLFFIPSTSFADTNLEDINYKKNIEVGKNFNIDLTSFKKNLEDKFGTNIFIEWNIKGETTKKGEIFKKKFENIGEKEINLSIYKLDNKEKNLLINKDINIFVFKESHFVITQTNTTEEKIENLIRTAKESGVYIIVNKIEEKKLNETDILETIKKYKNTIEKPSNYISIWGKKDFLLDVLSKLNKEIEISMYNEQLNISLISSFNAKVLQNYLNNFLSNKTWIDNIIMIDETSRFQIIKAPSEIKLLKEELVNNKYHLLELTTNIQISNILFISKFINNLSSKGFNAHNIYILLIIPFLFTGIGIFKHLIGLSPIGVIIPIFITILFFKIGLTASLILLSIIILINLALSKVVNKYTLLYTPKVSFISIINILIIIITINILYAYNLLNINISDSLFIILLIVISERLITVILSKEFREYKSNLFNTIIFCLLCYFIFNIGIIKTFTFAYPEIIILLIPLNFLIGRFTGLRVTEYFRFKEVIKNIEEE